MVYVSRACIIAGRPWPIAFGVGVGFGMSYANCQHVFKYPELYEVTKRITY